MAFYPKTINEFDFAATPVASDDEFVMWDTSGGLTKKVSWTGAIDTPLKGNHGSLADRLTALEDFWSPLMFGEVNTTNINWAIFWANYVGGGTVRIPAGNHAISGTIGGPFSNVKLVGAGVDATILTLDNNVNTHVISVTDDSDVQICDLTIDGNGTNQTTSNGIRGSNAQRITIRNVKILNACDYGIGFQGDGVSDLVVDSVIIEDSGSDGIDIKNSDSDNVGINILNTTVRRFDRGGNGNKAGIDIRGRANLSNCLVEQYGDTGGGSAGFRLRFGETIDAHGAGGHYSTYVNCRAEPYPSRDGGGNTFGFSNSARNASFTNCTAKYCSIGFQVMQEKNLYTNCSAVSCVTNGFKLTDDGTNATGCDFNVFTGNSVVVDDADVITGTAQSGGASSITLATTCSTVDDFYKDWVIEITGGTSDGEVKTVTAYNGSTKVATVNSAWAVQPNGTSIYLLAPAPTAWVFDDADYNICAGSMIHGAGFTSNGTGFSLDADSTYNMVVDYLLYGVPTVSSDSGSNNTVETGPFLNKTGDSMAGLLEIPSNLGYYPALTIGTTGIYGSVSNNALSIVPTAGESFVLREEGHVGLAGKNAVNMWLGIGTGTANLAERAGTGISVEFDSTVGERYPPDGIRGIVKIVDGSIDGSGYGDSTRGVLGWVEVHDNDVIVNSDDCDTVGVWGNATAHAASERNLWGGHFLAEAATGSGYTGALIGAEIGAKNDVNTRNPGGAIHAISRGDYDSAYVVMLGGSPAGETGTADCSLIIDADNPPNDYAIWYGTTSAGNYPSGSPLFSVAANGQIEVTPVGESKYGLALYPDDTEYFPACRLGFVDDAATPTFGWSVSAFNYLGPNILVFSDNLTGGTGLYLSGGAVGARSVGVQDQLIITEGSGQTANLLSFNNASAVTVASFTDDARLRAPRGVVSSVGVGFQGDPNTGMYSSGADALELVTAGATRLAFNSSGQAYFYTDAGADEAAVHIGSSSDSGSRLTFFLEEATPTDKWTLGCIDYYGIPLFSLVDHMYDRSLWTVIAQSAGTAISSFSDTVRVVRNTGQTQALFYGLHENASTVLFSIDSNGRIAADNGTLADCGFQFQGDPNTGLYSSTGDELSIVTGGTARTSYTTSLITNTIESLSAGRRMAYATSGTNISANATHEVIEVTAASSYITLPTASSAGTGKRYIVINTYSASNYVVCSGSDKFGGYGSDTETKVYINPESAVMFISDGSSRWFVLGANIGYNTDIVASPDVVTSLITNSANYRFGAGLSLPSGRYQNMPSAGAQTAVPTQNTVYYQPVIFGRNCTLDRVGVAVSSGGGSGSVVRFGLYNDSSGMPGTKYADWGTTASTGTGAIEKTLSSTNTPYPGLYWSAVVAQVGTSPTLRGRSTGLDNEAYTFMSDSSNTNIGAGTSIYAYTEASVTGALPASATVGGVYTTQNFTVLWRASA